jgi:uncharacterized membrane protein HdeD (DUF308 family)
MLSAALSRLLKPVAVITGLTAFVSLAVGLLLGASLARSLAIGFYLVGCFMIVAGFFLGNRGPVRQKDEGGTLLFGSRNLRWATPEELGDALSSSAFFIVLGLVLIVIGVLADTKHGLF